jgi:hypothetical protein
MVVMMLIDDAYDADDDDGDDDDDNYGDGDGDGVHITLQPDALITRAPTYGILTDPAPRGHGNGRAYACLLTSAIDRSPNTKSHICI